VSASGEEEIPIQFNPASLHFSRAATTDTGKTVGRTEAQHVAASSRTLSFDLHFDTADDGSDVLEKVRPIEAFLVPENAAIGHGNPPTVRFGWGTFGLSGLVQSLSVDLDLFSEDGKPLRAKVALTIVEQDPAFESRQTGPGTKKFNAVSPGHAGASAIGGIGLGVSASVSAGVGLGLTAGVGAGASISAGVAASGQTATAIEGESAAEFAARVGVDPTAWRAIAAGQLDATLSIKGGTEVDFSASFSAGAGIGASPGLEAGAFGSIEASFGLQGGPRPDQSVALVSAGFSLSAAGGVSAALETVAVVRSESAAAGTRRAFAAPARPTVSGAGSSRGLASLAPSVALAATGEPTATAPRPDRAAQPRRALAATGLPSLVQQAAARPVPPAPRADPRAVSFGYGVPLRPRVGGAAEARLGQVGAGTIALRPRVRGTFAPVANDPTVPSWTALPKLAPVPTVKGAAAGVGPCRCAGPCKCKGGR
jgi:hypothetical protein